MHIYSMLWKGRRSTSGIRRKNLTISQCTICRYGLLKVTSTYLDICTSKLVLPTSAAGQSEMHLGIRRSPKSAQVTCHTSLIKWAEERPLDPIFKVLSVTYKLYFDDISRAREYGRADEYCKNGIGDSLHSKRHKF